MNKKLNELDRSLLRNEVELFPRLASTIIEKAESFPYAQDQTLPSFAYINQHILSYIVLEHFLFPGFVRSLESVSFSNYEQIMAAMEIDEAKASSFVFKLVAFFESIRKFREGIDFINNLLQSYISTQQYEKAFIVIEFVFYYSERTSLKEINEAYYRDVQNQVAQFMTEREVTIEKLSAVVKQKYECLFSLIHYFDQKLHYSDFHMRILRNLFVASYSRIASPEQLQSVNTMTYLCLAFNNPPVLHWLWDFEAKLQRIQLKSVMPIAFLKIKRYISVNQVLKINDMTFYVMKFDYGSKNARKFRYLCVRNTMLAVVSKSKIGSLAKASSGQKGICMLIRLYRLDSKSAIRSQQP